MVEEPSSLPGLNLADALQRGIGLRLDRRFAGVNRRIYIVGLLITVLLVGGYALWSQFHDLKADLARARGNTDVIQQQAADQKARLARLDEKVDKNLAEIVRAIRAVADQTARLGKLEEKLDKNLAETTRAIREAAVRTEPTVSTTTPERASPFVAMTLSDEEREIIRQFFGVKKKHDATGFDAKVGDIAPETAPLYPVPSLLYKDVPKLKDHRFFADEANGTIVLVGPVDNRVVAIV